MHPLENVVSSHLSARAKILERSDSSEEVNLCRTYLAYELLHCPVCVLHAPLIHTRISKQGPHIYVGSDCRFSHSSHAWLASTWRVHIPPQLCLRRKVSGYGKASCLL